MPASDIRITEIMYDPSPVADNVGEFLELTNTGATEIDLAGWAIGNADGLPTTDLGLLPLLLPAGASLVLASPGVTQAQFETMYGSLPAGTVFAAATSQLELSNSGDLISLIDDTGTSFNPVQYPNTANAGESLEVTYDALGHPSFTSQSPNPGVSGAIDPPPMGATNGDDILSGDNTDELLDLMAGNDVFRAWGGDDSVFGGDGNDFVNAGTGADFVEGGADQDTLNGGVGDDTLFGDEGEDRIYGGNDNDNINGGDGRDQLYGQNGDDVIFGGDGNDKAQGGAGNDFIHGGAQNDRLYGNGGRDTLLGGENNDQLFGGGHNDRLFGETGNDRLYGATGDDYADGGSGHDRINGGQGNDTVLGDQGNDTLLGGRGMDELEGGSGYDTLIGGAGADIFLFHAGGQRDQINDFESGVDVVDISSFGLTGLGDLTVDDSSGSLVLSFDTGEELVLRGLTLADVTAADFLFV